MGQGVLEAPRGTREILVDSNFGPYFATKLAAAVGIWIINVVAAVTVFEATGSALLVGAISLAQFLPQVALGPMAGSLADRGNRLRLMVIGQLAAAASAGALATWAAINGIEGQRSAAVVISAAFVIGLGSATSTAATHAILPALVRPSELSTAVALDGTPFTLARAVGPAIGALVMSAAGPAAAFAIASAAFASKAAVALVLELRPTTLAGDGDRSVRGGLRYLRQDRSSALLLLGVAVVGVGIDPVLTLAPPIASSLGDGERLVGWLVSVFGLGSAVAVALVGPLRKRLGIERLSPIGLAIFGTAYVAVAFSSTKEAVLLAFLVAGSGSMLAITSLTTQLQTRLPEEFRGRIMALWAVAYLGSRPVAAAFNGAMADYVSVRAALLVTTAILLVGVSVVRRTENEPVGSRRQRD